MKAYYACDYGQAIAVLFPKAKEQGKDHVLYNLALLSAALAAGDYDTAEKASRSAQSLMWNVEAGTGKGTASLISAESIKIFKGEPFEKSMASIYSGIIYFNRGDYDNARAAFSKALMAVKSKEKGHQNDFALASLLQAKTFLKLGEVDNARVALGRAKKVYPDNPFLDPGRLQSASALFVIELGRGPQKVRTGPGDSLVEWKRRDYPERSAALYVDDELASYSQEAGDLTVEAKTKGWSGKDTVQVTKGVARDAAAVTAVIAADKAVNEKNKTAGWVALGAGLFAVANQSQADVRQWEFLPDRLHVVSARLKPGPHKLAVVFLGEGRNPIPGYDKVWYYDPVGGEKIFLVRSNPCPAGNNMAMSP